MNIIQNIEGQIYDLMTDMHALDDCVRSVTDNDRPYRDNIYWTARGMCRVACQFTNDKDECEMFDRIQQAVLQQIANDKANNDDDDREEVAAEVTAHVETVDDRTAATLDELFGGTKSPVDCKPDIPVMPAPVMEAQSGDIFF